MSYQPPVDKPTNTLAVVSLAFGIASWCVFPMLGAMVAIVCGHMARSEIRREAGATQGDGFAIAGLVLGYIQLVFAVLGALIVIGLLMFGVGVGLHTMHGN